MAVNFTKRNVAAMAEALDQEYETLDDAAAAALEAAVKIIESRAKFTVVGQVKHPENKGDKIALGWYVTEKQALEDALKLTMSNQTHEEAYAWVLGIHHGTPFDWYKGRKRDRLSEELADLRWSERELQRRIEWFEQHPGAEAPKDWGVVPYQSATQLCDRCYGTGRYPLTGKLSA